MSAVSEDLKSYLDVVRKVSASAAQGLGEASDPTAVLAEAGLVELGHAGTLFRRCGPGRGAPARGFRWGGCAQAKIQVTSLAKPMSKPVTSAVMTETKTMTTVV